MTYSFRIRFKLGDSVRFTSPDNEAFLTGGPGDEASVVLKAPDEVQLSDASDLVVRGAGYTSEADAESAANEWKSLLQIAFARSSIGANFGDRELDGGLTSAGEDWMSIQTGNRVLNDHGIMAFKTNPPPAFSRSTVTATRGIALGPLLEAINSARKQHVGLGPLDQVAFDLFSASAFVRVADARFLMLMMAVETLISRRPRSYEVIEHCENLIMQTEQSGLPPGQVQSLVASLNDLKRESIGQAGRELAASLSGRTYEGMEPRQFFKRCYEIRSRLVHGHSPRVPVVEVNQLVGPLEVFVGDLLSRQLSVTSSG